MHKPSSKSATEPLAVVAGAGPSSQGAPKDLEAALMRLVSRGAITQEQQVVILSELALCMPAATVPNPSARSGPDVARKPRRSLSQALIEVGLYVGSALVVAAAFVLAAQNWGEVSQATQLVILVVTALATGAFGLVLAMGSQFATARRRLAGVLLAGTAASCAMTVAVAMGDDARFVGAFSLGAALIVMVLAQVVATSAVTELGMFGAGFLLLEVLVQEINYPPQQLDSVSYEPTMTSRLLPLILVAFGLLWALAVAPRLAHRELGVALGVLVAVITAIAIAGDPVTRIVGLAVLALLAAVGFWRYLVDSMWPWLAGAIASVTAFVFWAVGGADRPALAILVAGLVMLGSSAVGWELAHRRQRHPEAPAQPPALERID